MEPVEHHYSIYPFGSGMLCDDNFDQPVSALIFWDRLDVGQGLNKSIF